MVNQLSAIVVNVPGRSKKCRYATEITIKLGTLDVAKTTIGGRWSQRQAMDEFKRNPQKFTPCSGILPSTLLSLASSKMAA